MSKIKSGDGTSVPAGTFDQHIRAAVAIALAADFPLPFGDALQKAAELIYREARREH